MNCSPDEPLPAEGAPSEADELVDFITSAVYRIPGSSADRAYRACCKVFDGFGYDDLGRGYIAIYGTLPAKEFRPTLERLNVELRTVCAEPMMIASNTRLCWLGITEDVISDRGW